MSFSKYTTLYDEVLPDVPGVPQNVALNAIRNSVIELCDKSGILIVDQDAVSAAASESAYDFEPPNGYVVASVVAVWFNSIEILPTNQKDLFDSDRDWTTRTGQPTHYIQENR